MLLRPQTKFIMAWFRTPWLLVWLTWPHLVGPELQLVPICSWSQTFSPHLDLQTHQHLPQAQGSSILRYKNYVIILCSSSSRHSSMVSMVACYREFLGSNPGKGESIFRRIWILFSCVTCTYAIMGIPTDIRSDVGGLHTPLKRPGRSAIKV